MLEQGPQGQPQLIRSSVGNGLVARDLLRPSPASVSVMLGNSIKMPQKWYVSLSSRNILEWPKMVQTPSLWHFPPVISVYIDIDLLGVCPFLSASTLQAFGLWCCAGRFLRLPDPGVDPVSPGSEMSWIAVVEVPWCYCQPPVWCSSAACPAAWGHSNPASRDQGVRHGLGWAWFAEQSFSWVAWGGMQLRSCRNNWLLTSLRERKVN